MSSSIHELLKHTETALADLLFSVRAREGVLFGKYVDGRMPLPSLLCIAVDHFRLIRNGTRNDVLIGCSFLYSAFSYPAYDCHETREVRQLLADIISALDEELP